MSQLTFSWKQEVPYPGKRRLAGDVARAEVEAERQQAEEVALRVRAEVKSAYAELHRLDRTMGIVRESRKLLESFRDSARARYESGAGILENVLKAQTELTKLDAELVALAQERRTAEILLNGLLGRVRDAPLAQAAAAPLGDPPDPSAAEAEALRRSPELLALRAQLRRGESQLDLARREMKPDFMWGAAYMSRGGLDPMVMGMVGVRLPLYRKHKQARAVSQWEHLLLAFREELSSGEVRVACAVRDLLARARKAGMLIDLYSEGVLPQARSALDSAAASYAVGQADFLTLIEDFLTVLTYETELEKQRAERISALAGLEPLSGATLVRPGPLASAQGAQAGIDE